MDRRIFVVVVVVARSEFIFEINFIFVFFLPGKTTHAKNATISEWQ